MKTYHLVAFLIYLFSTQALAGEFIPYDHKSPLVLKRAEQIRNIFASMTDEDRRTVDSINEKYAALHLSLMNIEAGEGRNQKLLELDKKRFNELVKSLSPKAVSAILEARSKTLGE